MESKRLDWDVFRVDNLPTVSKNNQLDSLERVLQMLTIKSDAAKVEISHSPVKEVCFFDTHTEESRQV